MSVTVTAKLPLAVLPCASAAEQVTVVVPTENANPEDGMQTGTITPSTTSAAVAVNMTAVPAPVASVVMLAGSVRTGALGSVTVTVKLELALLPCASVAVHVTVVTPTGKSLPDAGVQTGVTGPSMASAAVAVKLTSVVGPVATVVRLAGSVSTGGVRSTMAMPESATVTAPPPELVALSWSVFGPASDGWNVTGTVVAAAAAVVVITGRFVTAGVPAAKSAPTVTVGALSVTGATVKFVIATLRDCAAGTTTEPKSTAAGDACSTMFSGLARLGAVPLSS